MIAENECLQLDIKLRFTTCCKSTQREMEQTDFDNPTSYFIICFWFIVHDCAKVQVNFSKTFEFTRKVCSPDHMPYSCSSQDRTRHGKTGQIRPAFIDVSENFSIYQLLTRMIFHQNKLPDTRLGTRFSSIGYNCHTLPIFEFQPN